MCPFNAWFLQLQTSQISFPFSSRFEKSGFHWICTVFHQSSICTLQNYLWVIDLTHNDIKQRFCGSNGIVGVVVTNDSNMVSFFPEVGNLNGSNANICSDVAGHQVAVRAICFDFGSSSRSRTLTISTTISTTDRYLGFGRDYNYYTPLRGVLCHYA